MSEVRSETTNEIEWSKIMSEVRSKTTNEIEWSKIMSEVRSKTTNEIEWSKIMSEVRSETTNEVEWSGCAESNRGYKHPMLAYYHYTTPRLRLWRAGTPGRVLPTYYSPKIIYLRYNIIFFSFLKGVRHSNSFQ